LRSAFITIASRSSGTSREIALGGAGSLKTDRLDGLVQRRIRQFVRAAAGHQLVEQHAQRVHIRSGAHGRSAHLFGTRIFRRQRPDRGFRARALRVEQLGNPEIEQFGRPFAGHQSVGRLDVAMNHQVLVRELHAIGKLQEQAQPGLRIQPIPRAVIRDGSALHILHHDVGRTFGSIPAVQKTGDIGVRQRGQNLPLLQEAADRFGTDFQAGPHQFDGYFLLEIFVLAPGPVNRSHAARPDLFHQQIVPNPPSLMRVGVRFQKGIRSPVRTQQRCDFVAHLRPALALARDPGILFGFRQLQSALENAVYFTP
jgi:hypothetical protein